jgi:transcriptional regulator GlxA family with amidase domain
MGNVVFLLLPDFTMIAFTSAVEALRSANRMLDQKAYHWRLCSMDGNPVSASNEVQVTVSTSIDDERKMIGTPDRATLFMVCGGTNIDRHITKSVTGILREEHARGIAVGGLCTGAYALASAGLLAGKRCAIHWENLPGFQEAFPNADVYADLFEIDGNIYTCAGGTAAMDMMLHLIGQDFNDDLVNRICEQMLTDRVRAAGDRQRLPLRARLGVQNSRILSIIELMEANLSEPLSLIDIADHVGLSRRQIERLFRQEMGRSPARYYLEIRLDRARHLLVQSSLPVVEIAIACGFVSASHFSKCYRELYARSPQQERAERKQLLIA